MVCGLGSGAGWMGCGGGLVRVRFDSIVACLRREAIRILGLSVSHE